MRYLMIFFLLTACHNKAPYTQDQVATSSRYIYGKGQPIQLEIVTSPFGVDLFLNSLYGTIQDSRIAAQVGEKITEIQGQIYRGGQRIKLDPDLFGQIITCDDETLTIGWGRYKLSLPLSSVLKSYQTMRGKYEQAQAAAKNDDDRR